MNATTTELKDLLTRAQDGDAGAALRFRDEMEPALRRIVGRALRADTRPTLLTRHVQSAAREGPAAQGGWSGDSLQEGLVNDVAAGLARSAERRLLGAGSARQPLRETIRDRA